MPTVCDTCQDTHMMTLGERTVMCTRCPTPCESCRQRYKNAGPGAYCASTPCGCACHGSIRLPSVLTNAHDVLVHAARSGGLHCDPTSVSFEVSDKHLQEAAIRFVAELARVHPDVLDFRADAIACLKPIKRRP